MFLKVVQHYTGNNQFNRRVIAVNDTKAEKLVISYNFQPAESYL